jgi:hypothetical protein
MIAGQEQSQPRPSRAGLAAAAVTALVFAALAPVPPTAAQVHQSVPFALRGQADAEREGTHDANRIRTTFWNFGMVGDYPPDPGNVDLSVFHSVEVPKGTGMDYSDGITPFVLAQITQRGGVPAYIMETGFRERQGISPYFNRIMRFEPRPGYFQPDPSINKGRAPAISNDPRTWPATWPDKATDPTDPGWNGSWDGYFGKRPAADQESYTVMDDQYYDAWDFSPDSTDSTRKGLGLRVEVRGFQWSNPQAGNVIFWHYDITNEGTTDYNDNVIFGLYMDSGVGGSALSCDNIYESDDDNAFFDKSSRLNLVYTWDNYGHGVDLISNCDRTGYLGYAYLETPGNPFNGVDDDDDGIIDESRDSGPGTKIVGQDNILAYVAAHYDTTKFVAAYGPIAQRPAYRAGEWWTGDEDMDWRADLNDVGADGVPGTHDTGEGDGIPTAGEPNFDQTDLNESDQIGLTGFKLNRIKAGAGNPDQTADNILFYTDAQNWPQRLYEQFTDQTVSNRFDRPLATNYNIAFLFASGPFELKASKRERFSLALAFGDNLSDLRTNVATVKQIYDANYQFAVPPPMPTLAVESGDGRVRLSWDDAAERGVDPVTNINDFEGYRIYRSTDPEFLDPQVITNGNGTGPQGNGKPIAQFDLIDGKRGFSKQVVDGVAYWLGDDTGIQHEWVDSTVTNGQQYYYAVTAYDFGYDPGSDSAGFYPSENAIAVSRTPRGGLILPKNVVTVRPEPKVSGFTRAVATTATHTRGSGTGSVAVEVVTSTAVPDGHVFKVEFAAPSPDSVRAESYSLIDSTDSLTLYKDGVDFRGTGSGPVADGLLALVVSDSLVRIDPASGWDPGHLTNINLKVSAQPVLSPNLRRPGYPDPITIQFYDTVVDTGLALPPTQKKPAKFHVIAHTPQGDLPLKFAFLDINNDGTLSARFERIDIVTYPPFNPNAPNVTWRAEWDTTGLGAQAQIPPKAGDVYQLKLTYPLQADDQFVFSTTGDKVAGAPGTKVQNQPYVVPNPYVGAASFEPARFAVSGRGERRLEFRAVPHNGVVRIYTVRGDLVQTLRQDGGQDAAVPWDLRTKDNLDVAPGLYVYQVEAPGAAPFVGKFAVIK